MSDSKASAHRPKIIGIGLVSLDFVVSRGVRSWAGGTCGNVLAILASLGWDAYPVVRLAADAAGQRVRADLARWGVRLDFAGCAPMRPTPIIIEEIRRQGHRFGWSCPRCGERLPRFLPVTREAADAAVPTLRGASALFMDRVSPAALLLATRAAAEGAVIVFEPQSPGDPRLFAAAIRIAHVVKYSAQRLPSAAAAMRENAETLLEVQTLGAEGLRYRHRDAPEWTYLDAVPAARLVDACGSGDWCTAGLIAKAAAGGVAGLRAAGPDGIRDALRHGQALAAWNCGFEGARGGMYDGEDAPDAVIACPACSP